MMNYTESNKMIAEFMGLDVPYNTPIGFTGRTTTKFLKPKNVDDWNKVRLYYHKSWEYLMPVVEKIIDYKYDDEPDGTAFLRTFGMKDEQGLYMVRFNRCVLHSEETLLNATYMACLDFIENDRIWHATKTQE
jgi:hypothetical protein